MLQKITPFWLSLLSLAFLTADVSAVRADEGAEKAEAEKAEEGDGHDHEQRLRVA